MHCLLSERIDPGERSRRDGGAGARRRAGRHPAVRAHESPMAAVFPGGRASRARWSIAWESLERLRPGWVRRAVRAGIEREDAEDLFQEALLASLEGLERLRVDQGRSVEEAFLAWFWGILRHKLISEVRRRKRARAFAERRVSEGAAAVNGSAAVRVRCSLGLLERSSPESARILRRRFLEGWELREMAWDLGVSVPTACRRVQAALAEIRGCMGRALS
jgi:RNA polymerase sigma factor (sigma-70 family)